VLNGQIKEPICSEYTCIIPITFGTLHYSSDITPSFTFSTRTCAHFKLKDFMFGFSTGASSVALLSRSISRVISDTTHLCVSCHAWICHGTHDWVTAHMDEYCSITCALGHTWHYSSFMCVMPRTNVSRHTWLSHVAHRWLVSHHSHIHSCPWCMWDCSYMCVMPHMNKSRHTRVSLVTHQWVMPHINASPHTWTGHVTNERVMNGDERIT